MDPLCEFCGVVRAVVYCKSDSARLCLNCDGSVHAANSLSRRHPRSLICDKCYCQPAIVHCMDDKMSLCQDCDCNQNDCSGLGHRRMALHCYTGCPSFSEMSGIWSFALEPASSSSSGSLDNNGWGSLNTLPKNGSKCLEQPDNINNDASFSGKLNEIESSVKYEPWMAQSSILQPNPAFMPQGRDQPVFFPQDSSLPKVFLSTVLFWLLTCIF